ncbi:interferon-induced very large GTPase 1-like [Ctenodactylus gundi]
MATADCSPDKALLRGERTQELQDMLTQLGLDDDFWLPKLQEHLGVTSAQALQHLNKDELEKLKSQTQHQWEKRALERLLELSHLRRLPESQLSPGEVMTTRHKQAEQALQELRELMSAGRQRQDDTVRRKEAELRQALGIPEQYWPRPEEPLREVVENTQRQLVLMQQTLSHKQNLPDCELVRWASGGLALQGIYKTNNQQDLIQKREELLCVPKEFKLYGPEQGTRMETKEFTSSQAESMFTKSIEKLGFSATASAKGGGWGVSLEVGLDQSKHSESEKHQQSHSEHSYFCSTKFSYIPLASCHFPTDQLQLSQAALQELQSIENLLDHTADPNTFSTLRHRSENFFKRFGSHANQGPLHVGGIYWWKAISERFQSEQLADVKQQTAEALDIYIRGSYSGFGVKVTGSLNVSESQSERTTDSTNFHNRETKVKLYVAQTGGPPGAEGLIQWKNGLVVNNQTWCVIDRGLHLVPIWDIILSNHRSDFKDSLRIATCLKDSYTALTGHNAQIQYGEELWSAEKEAKIFLQDMKSWEVSDPEMQLTKMIDFMQKLCQKSKSYDMWISLCLTDWVLQNFLVNTVKFCKASSIYVRRFIKSQLRTLLDPHIYKVTNFPQTHSIMQWIYEVEAEEDQVNISQISQFIKILKEIQNDHLELKIKSESPESVEESQRKLTNRVTLALKSFLNYLKEANLSDIQLLLLSIAAGAGYHTGTDTFQYLLGSNELYFLVDEIQMVYNNYQELKNDCTYRAQAFLVLKSLTATVRVTALSSTEKTQRMALIRQHLEKSLTTEVEYVFNKPRADHDWQSLEKDLRLLKDGDYEATISSLQMEQVKRELETLFPEKKQTDKTHHEENNKQEVIENADFLEVLQRLDLEHYFPKRMSRADFHLIYKTSVYNTPPSSERELPFYFLQKLLMIDYRLRYLIFRDEEKIKSQIYASASLQENEASDPFEDICDDGDHCTDASVTEPKPHIHPMDIQMAIFHCTDDVARQYILNKLSTCQFALPLLVPNPCNSQIEFSLWCLQKIRRSWQHTSKSQAGMKHSFSNQRMCQVPTPIVSFIRVGNGLSTSKSQVMNCLLSKRKHDVFFHRHCAGSTKHCVLMAGVVEICWFCPGGQDDDTFNTCVTFTNLHGDAKEHKQQLHFLQEVSSVIVILTSASDGNDKNREIVRDLWQSAASVICLLEDKEIITNNSGRRVRIGMKNRTEAELTNDLSITIRRLLELTDTALSIEDCSQIASKHGFLVDEEQRNCKEAKEKAQIIIALLKEENLTHMKKKFLPLQGQLWHLWCKKDKELYHLREKGNRSIEQHKSELEREKKIIRRQQLDNAFPPKDLIRSFLQILQEHSGTHTTLYILEWLSIFLDNLTSGHLENLREKQKSLWSLVQTEKQKTQKSTLLNTWHNEIEAISMEISDCTLGIQQFLREVAQMYEALEETASQRDILFLSLPQIAADLMISGVPIELMDGDASYVPLKWVGAVFDKLSERLGDKRLFVLSILGLQSSGKSTLLNALFGLQFTVSAGRCTKGASMQLLKVEETLSNEVGFDFLLVVDTEGLRAPELNNKSQNWDNELATFVIGIGNLTLINIFGENPSEMQDILQIAVQAFLRMKQVRISPSCLFVHQNVGEVTAKDQTMEGRRRLEQRLDEMVAMAAEQEQCSHVTRFTDVIKFDINAHIHYFAHLWDGNPPMAPPNPRYSYNVQELKNSILLTAKQEAQKSIMKITDIKIRVKDLWKALLSENFIFSFRNTREVMAMSKLEAMYNRWSWKLRSHMLEKQNQLNNQIQNGKIHILKRSTMESLVRGKYDEIKLEFEKYFDEDSDSEILIQWKANFENKLLNLKEALISDTVQKANELINLKKGQERLDMKKKVYENELLEKSRKLALSVKGIELSEEELEEKFNQLWTIWVYDVSSSIPRATNPNIRVESEDILLEHFKKEKNIGEKVRRKYGETFKINYDKHVQMNRGLIFRNSLEVSDKESIDMTTSRIFSRFDETINSIEKQQRDYNVNYFYDILCIIEEEVKSAPTRERYTFTSKYKLELSLDLFYRASKRFEEMHRAFKRANDPVNYLESKKGDFFMSFKISCQGATSIKSFVDFLWHKLVSAASKTIHTKMAPRIAEEMQSTIPAFNGNRANLEKHILMSLAQEENFDNYLQYIHQPEIFFRSYIEKHVKIYCSGKGDEKIKTFLKINLDIIKNAILFAISESTAIAKDKSSTASDWLDLFCDHLGNKLIFPRKDLISIEHQEIKDLEFLKEAMSAALDSSMGKVEENYLSMPKDEMFAEIEKILSEHLCGCWHQCPFCKAICTNTISRHDGEHSVPFHRSEAVNGWGWIHTNDFAIDFCTTLVASDVNFILGDGRNFPYKKYREAGGAYATWSITPDSSSQPYWKWFVCHFRSNLEKHYNKTFTNKGKIPDDWAKITKQDVLEHLR